SASPISDADEVIRQVNDSGASVLITLTRMADLARAALDATPLQQVIYTNIKDYLSWPQKAWFGLTREARDGHRAPWPLTRRERLWAVRRRAYRKNPLELTLLPSSRAAIQYTGGTPDKPKGVMLSHRALMANAFQSRHWLPGMKEGRERLLCVIPFA